MGMVKDMDCLTPRLLNIIFFVFSALIALAFLMKNQVAQIANPLTLSVAYLGIILLERYTIFKLKSYIRVVLIVTFLSHSLFGEYFRAYYTTGWFDNGLHLFGSFSFALFSYELLSTFISISSSKPKTLTFLLVSLLGICLGTFFELIEFSLDQLLHEHNQFGLIDTDLDLVFDVIGSLLAGLFVVKKNLLKELCGTLRRLLS